MVEVLLNLELDILYVNFFCDFFCKILNKIFFKFFNIIVFIWGIVNIFCFDKIDMIW